jgi:hypothetical protein
MKLTKKDFKKTDEYGRLIYEGSLETDEEIIIESNLGTVIFEKRLSSKKYIFASAGSGIKAGEGIKAGSGIKAGWGIEAGLGIEAGEGIKAGLGIVTFYYGLIAKWVSCLRIAVGFHSKEKQTIKAEIRKGDVILGEREQK